MDTFKVFILIIVLILLLIFVYYNGQEKQKFQYLPVPTWSRERFEFNESQTISLQFTYDYSSTIYSSDQTQFYVGLWKCGDSCPTPKSFPPTPSPNQFVTFIGNDPNYQVNSNTYSVSMSPPTGGLWQVGNYTAYVIAMLSKNHNVQSDPSDPAPIDITPPSGGPPTPTISYPSDGEYFPSNETTVQISWTVSSEDYPGFYTFTVQITDDSIGSNPLTPVEGIPSTVTSQTLSLYAGQFKVTVISVASDTLATSSSKPVTFYIKLPTPSNVTAVGS